MGVEAFAVEQRVFEAFDDGDFTVLQAHVGLALDVDLVAAVHAIVMRVNWRNAKGFQRGADDFVVVERGHADAGRERLVRFVEDLLLIEFDRGDQPVVVGERPAIEFVPFLQLGEVPCCFFDLETRFLDVVFPFVPAIHKCSNAMRASSGSLLL